MIETQRTITTWADATFGQAPSIARICTRANEEMAELLKAITVDGPTPDKLMEEAADVVIVLYRLAEKLGQSLNAAVDRKMSINRSREWKVDNGDGYHVKEKK